MSLFSPAVPRKRFYFCLTALRYERPGNCFPWRRSKLNLEDRSNNFTSRPSETWELVQTLIPPLAWRFRLDGDGEITDELEVKPKSVLILRCYRRPNATGRKHIARNTHFSSDSRRVVRPRTRTNADFKVALPQKSDG